MKVLSRPSTRNSSKRVAYLAPFAALALMLALTACGDETNGSGQQDGSTSDQETTVDDNGNGNDSPASGASFGTIEVDGVSYDVTTMHRCDPDELYDDPALEMFNGLLSLQAVGQADGSRFVLHIDVVDSFGTETDELTWQGPEGLFDGHSSDPGSNVTINWSDGDREASGSGTLAESRGADEEINLSFSVEVPSGFDQC